MKKRKIVVLRGYLAAGKSTTFNNLKKNKKMKDWVFLDFPAIRKLYNNFNIKTQISLADMTFFNIMRELLKTRKNILTQETSNERLIKELGEEIKKNNYNVDIIVLTISKETSLKRDTERRNKKGIKLRTKKEVYENYNKRIKKLLDGKIYLDTEKNSEKQIVDKIIKRINQDE